MAVYEDGYGLPVTTTSRQAADHSTRGVALMLARNAGAQDALKEAVEADEAMPLAHIALAAGHQTAARVADAKAAAAKARETVAGASPREQRQVEFIATAIEGKGPRAIDLAQEHLKEFPRDAMVVQQLTNVLTNSGRQDRKEAIFRVQNDV